MSTTTYMFAWKNKKKKMLVVYMEKSALSGVMNDFFCLDSLML